MMIWIMVKPGAFTEDGELVSAMDSDDANFESDDSGLEIDDDADSDEQADDSEST